MVLVEYTEYEISVIKICQYFQEEIKIFLDKNSRVVNIAYVILILWYTCHVQM